MNSIGQTLKSERISQNREIQSIAAELCIGSRYLEAIEAEQWEQLPGAFFNKSFVRQYAQALKLDAAAIEAELASILQRDAPLDVNALSIARDPRARREEEKKLIAVEPLDSPGSRFLDPRTRIAFAALVLILVAGGGVSMLWERRAAFLPAATPTPQPVLQTVSTPAPEPKAAEPAATIVANADGQLSLNISANERTWIEVIADGKRIFVGVLQPGESKSINTAAEAKMVVGNAGGVSVQKSGRDIGPIGPRGQVRVVNITGDGVKISDPQKSKTDDNPAE